MAMDKNIFFWFSVAFCVFGLSEAMISIEFATKVRLPLIDGIVLTVASLSPLMLASGAALLSWNGQSARLCLWVLAFWWEWYTVVSSGITVTNVTTYIHVGNWRHLSGFLLFIAVTGFLVQDLFRTPRVQRSRKIALPIATIVIVFLPWFGSLPFSNDSVVELALVFFYAIAFVCVFGYEWINRTPSSR